MLSALRNEMYRQIGQFERDKVGEVDARARKKLIEHEAQIVQIHEVLSVHEEDIRQLKARVKKLEEGP